MFFLKALLEITAPLLALGGTVIAPIAAAALVRLFQKWGIDIEATHRDALQTALHNAAQIAADKLLGGIVTGQTRSGNNVRDVAVDMAVDYVKKSVPDAIGKFKLDRSRLIELLQPHIADALTKKKA